MPLIFSARRPRRPGAPARRVRPVGTGQPAQGAAAREPVRRAAAGPRRCVDLMTARHRRRRALRDDRPGRAWSPRSAAAPTGRSAARRRPATSSCRCARPSASSTYDPADLTVTVARGDDLLRRARRRCSGAEGQECALDPRDPDAPRVGGLLATGLSGHRRLRLRTPARPRAGSALRHRRRPARQGRGPDGQERERLRPPPAARRIASAPSACWCRSRCGASRVAATAAWFTTDADPFALRRAPVPPFVPGVGRHAHARAARGSRRPTSPPSGRSVDDAAEGARALPHWPDGRASRSHLGATLGVARHWRLRSNAAGVRWIAEVGVGTVHVAADDDDALARCTRRGRRGRGLDAARGRRARSRRLRRPPLPNAKLAGARPRRVRSRRQVARPAASRARRPMLDATTAGAGTRRARRDPPGRRGRARRVRRLRAVPAALPDVPRHRARAALAARSDRGHAGGRVRRRTRSTTRSATPSRPACSAAAARPRARRRCRSGISSRAPTRRSVDHPAPAADAAPGAAGGSRSGSGSRSCSRGTGSCSPRTWVLLVAQRLHLVPRRLGLPELSARSLRTPLVADAGPADAYLFPGLRDGRVAARRAPRGAAR